MAVDESKYVDLFISYIGRNKIKNTTERKKLVNKYRRAILPLGYATLLHILYGMSL